MTKEEFKPNGDPLDKSNADQFLKLYVSNHKRIYTFILTLVPNWDDAEDLMQETISEMWHKYNEFEPGTNFSAWGIRISRYKIMEFYRKRRRMKSVEFSNETLEAILACATEINDRMEENLKTLRECLAKLSERDRYLVQMRYEEGITIKKIANRIGRPIHGFYKSMARIHNQLLQCVLRFRAAKEAFDG